MKNRIFKNTFSRLLPTLALVFPLLATALELDEIREFGEVFEVSAKAIDRQSIEVSWKIADGYYLYNNKFLKFKTETSGVVLGEAAIPEGEKKFDELLAEEVIKFHDRLVVTLPLESVAPGINLVSLKLRSQGCMEDVFCYPPTEQLLAVNLPEAAQGVSILQPPHSTTTLADVFNKPLEGLGQDAINTAPAFPADEAFVYEAIGLSAETILVRLTAQPDYYLYRDKLAFRVVDGSGFDIAKVEMPEGTIKDDPEFGPVQVYYGQIEIPVHITRPAGPEQNISLQADYQGCRDGDICYPPQTSSAQLLISASASAIGPVESSKSPLTATNCHLV